VLNIPIKRGSTIGEVPRINWSNPITQGLKHLVVSVAGRPVQLYGSGMVVLGNIGANPTPFGMAANNSGETVGGGTANNYISLPPLTVEARPLTVLFVGGRRSTPGGGQVAIAISTRFSGESTGVQLELGNGYGDANALYWQINGGGSLAYVNGVPQSGVNPTDTSIRNGVTYSVVGSATYVNVGGGHNLLAKADGISDFAFDTFFNVYALWDRQLSNAESISLSGNPKQLFLSASKKIAIGAGVSGLPTLSAARAKTGSITSTGWISQITVS
jgi:hypothetical protein